MPGHWADFPWTAGCSCSCNQNSSFFYKNTHKMTVWVTPDLPWPLGRCQLALDRIHYSLEPRFPLVFVPWIEKEQNALTLALSWHLRCLVGWISADIVTAGGTEELCKGETRWYSHILACLSALPVPSKGSCVWKNSISRVTTWTTSDIWL